MSKYPDWVTKHKKKGTAIHKIGNNYYLYEVTSVWDSKLGRPRKITKKYLGVITPEGLKEPKYRRSTPSTVKEYGASQLIIHQNREIIDSLKEIFPQWWEEIFILSAIRFMHNSPLKNMRIYYEDSWLSEEIKGARLSDKVLHTLFEEVGRDRERIVKFLRRFVTEGENLLIDLTHIFSLSRSMSIAERGYNREFNFNPQVNLLFMFSFNRRFPLFYRVLPGSVRDVSTMKATIEESGVKDVIVIGDKGFYSRKNVELFEENGIDYILPLRRNNKLIDYGVLESGRREEFDGYFKFNGRYIWYYRVKGVEPPLWVYLDERLKVEEEEDYLMRIETHPEDGYTEEGFYKKLPRFGTIALLTNRRDLTAEKVYKYFKSRVQIEILFDTLKNILMADKSYMRSSYSMECWMFINYLALVYYYKIYHLLLEKGLLRKYTPQDVVLYLSRYRRVKISKEWIEVEIPKKTRDLIEKLNLPIT